MKNTLFIVLVLFVIFNCSAQKKYKYPETPKDSFIDIYFDDKIYDPYQWMENSEDSRLNNWLNTQYRLTERETDKYLDKWTLRSQIGSMYYDVKYDESRSYMKKNDSLKGKYIFKYRKSSTKRSLDLLYKRRGSELNFNKLFNIKDYTPDKNSHIDITNTYVNEDYDLIAIEISNNGSDWREIYFFNLITGEQFEHKLKNIRISSSCIWLKDAFVYDAFDTPEKGRELLDKAKGQKLYYHNLTESQSEDKLLYQNPDVTGTNSFRFSKRDEKIIFHHYLTVKGKTYRALSLGNIRPESFYLSKFLIYPNSKEIQMTVEELEGDVAILNTNWEAKNGRVLKANINQLNQVSEFIPEYDIMLKNVNKLGKNKLACIYFDNGKDVALIFNLEGELLRRIDFPEGKKLNYLYESNEDVTHTDFSISSFYHPDIWYQLSLEDLTFKPAGTTSIPYDAEKLETKYVTYTSKDGTEVPMYITHLKGVELDENNPTLLYGYGGYGVTVEPRYDQSQTLWLLHGGVLAVPNIRGGGAKGNEWALAGRRLNKQKAIDDFISAAEFLISEKYTNPEKLAINGGSHGGMLVGASMIQRPELFKAVIAEAGPFDMLRFEKYTVASVNVNLNEFGNTAFEEDYFNLKSYSPLHNIKEGVKYPNLLLITGSDDDRVPPLHSYKFLATLQEKGSNTSLYILHVVNGSGHGGAISSEEFTQKISKKYSFLFNQLGIRI
ncbi:MAG: hypothetical protein CMC76_08540 [Flavobacteriaceae bacterium]|nr:hypothetical protein [Flavobacteriaceae bacterium]